MEQSRPYLDHSLPLAERISDLLLCLEPEEKLGLMASRQEAVPRLGMGEYHIGGEAAHGLQSPDGPSTLFPQTIGLASTWDEALLGEIGSVIADEARAYYRKRGGLGGLSLWAPTVDMERDPRWGRTEEAYGEDPVLGGRLSASFVRGMKGDHPFYLKAAPTPKHFYGNNNERGRGSSSASIDPRCRREYYLKAFEPAIADAGAPSLMTAYNAVNGRPAMLHPDLEEVVRGEWGFSGFAVCDAGSLGMLVSEHRFCPDIAHAVAAAVKAGIDNFSEEAAVVKPALREALEKGLLFWPDIDRALGRVLGVRFRLGQFDPAGSDPYASIGESALWDEAHRALALRAARESVVLLQERREGLRGLLPYEGSSPRGVAIIGPLAGEVYRDWYGATPAYRVSPLAAFSSRLPRGQVRFADGCDIVSISTLDGRGVRALSWIDPGLAADRAPGRGGERFRLCDWGWGNATLRSLSSGRYVTTDDAILEAKAEKVWGWFVRERFSLEPVREAPAALYLRTWKGEYVGLGEDRRLVVLRGAPGAGPRPEPFLVERARDGVAEAAEIAASADAAFVFVGNHPLLVAKEELDRDEIGLAPEQERLVEAVLAANPRTAVVVVGGYPFALGPWRDKAAAVLHAAHGGQEAGNAIADVVFGDYNPAGRLPMTWYRSLDQIGGIMDYDVMRGGRTYRYFEGDALYPFGHGLSYSRFEYSWASPRGEAAGGGEGEGRALPDGEGGFVLPVGVANVEGPPGDEVVQLYATCKGSCLRRPLAQLLDFRRVFVPAGERVEIALRARRRDLAAWDVRRNRYFVEGGDWELRVSASSADARLTTMVRVEGGALPPRNPLDWTSPDSFDDQRGAELDWSAEEGCVVRLAEGAKKAWLRFEDADFGPGGHIGFEARGVARAGGPAASALRLAVVDSALVEVEQAERGRWRTTSPIAVPPGRQPFELQVEGGLGLGMFRFVAL